MLRVQQACRRHIQELEPECIADLQSVVTPQVPWSTCSTSDSFDVQLVMVYSLHTTSKRDNTGTGTLRERGVAGACELPKRLNDHKGWKILHDALADESACLSPERQRRHN